MKAYDRIKNPDLRIMAWGYLHWGCNLSHVVDLFRAMQGTRYRAVTEADWAQALNALESAD